MLTVATKNSSIDRSASDEILFCQKLNIENATSGAIRATRSHYLLTQVKDVVALFASGAYGLASVAGEYRPNRGGKAGREHIAVRKIAGAIDESKPGADSQHAPKCVGERINRQRSHEDAGRAVENAPDNSAIEAWNNSSTTGDYIGWDSCL